MSGSARFLAFAGFVDLHLTSLVGGNYLRVYLSVVRQMTVGRFNAATRSERIVSLLPLYHHSGIAISAK